MVTHSDKKTLSDQPAIDKKIADQDVLSPVSRGIKPRKKNNVAMLWLGWFLLIIAPIVGAIPGPGFIIIFPIGLALVLKNSRWAKGLYVKFTRKFPHYGAWANWALRRKGQKEMPPLPPVKEQIKSLFRRGNT